MLHSSQLSLFFFLLKKIFIQLRQVLVATCRISDLHCSMWELELHMWDQIPWPGIKPGTLALGEWSLSHWTIREDPQLFLLKWISFLYSDILSFWRMYWISLFYESVKVEVLVPQSCLTLCDLMDYSPPDSSVRGILQARILEWIAIPFSRESFWPRGWTQVSHRQILHHLSHQGTSTLLSLCPCYTIGWIFSAPFVSSSISKLLLYSFIVWS